jgi:hypothetical protein
MASYPQAGGPRLADFLNGLPILTRWHANVTSQHCRQKVDSSRRIETVTTPSGMEAGPSMGAWSWRKDRVAAN